MIRRAYWCAFFFLLPSLVVAAEYHLFIGTYTQGDSRSKGIQLARYNSETGEVKFTGLAAETENPSFLAIHPNRKWLYAVNELGNGRGEVEAFSIGGDGRLKRLNEQSSEGDVPCHLVVDKTGKHVLLANYISGTVASLPIREDGTLGAATSVARHKGSSVDKSRQEGPHAHSINLSADNRFALAADLGTDKVYVYKFREVAGLLTAHDPPAVSVSPGNGPRHFAWHPSGKVAYANGELTAEVTVFGWDTTAGTLTAKQTISTLPEGFEGRRSTAEILVHPTGRFVYCSNRGHDSIAVFAAGEDGQLKFVECVGTGGKEPRNFMIAPDGRFLLAANQKSDSVVVFSIDEKLGTLKPTEHRIDVPRPVCLRMLEIR